MQDHPTIDQLLEAVARYLRDDVMQNTTGRTNFHGRVAMNVVEMLRREISTLEDHYAREWAGLDHLLGPQAMPSRLKATEEQLLERNRALSARIRNGDADSGDWRASVVTHLRTVVQDKLVVSNPALAAEE